MSGKVKRNLQKSFYGEEKFFVARAWEYGRYLEKQ